MQKAIEAVHKWIIDLINGLNGEGGNLTTPLEKYSEDIYEFVDKIVKNVTLPVAYTILALFFVTELYKMSLKTESMGSTSIGAENIFKLLFKVVICKTMLESTPLILKAIYSASIHLISGSITVLKSIVVEKDELTKLLESVAPSTTLGFFGELVLLLLMFISYLIVLIAVVIAGAMVVGRFVEIYVYYAIAPIPLATLISEEQSQIGKNFLKSFAAVCIQGFLIYLVLAFFPVIFSALIKAQEGIETAGYALQFIGFGFVLIMALFSTNKSAKSICNAM